MAKATEKELELHQRLLDGDETVSSEIFESYLNVLIPKLEKKYWGVAQYQANLIWDIVADAIFKYIEQPDKYKPDMLSLSGYLRMSSEGDLKNILSRMQNNKVNEESFEKIVEVEEDLRNKEISTEETPEKQLLNQEVMERLYALLSDPTDREIVLMMCDGIRSTNKYAAVLDILDMPIEQQEHEVKKVKDRLKIKLKRANWKGIINK